MGDELVVLVLGVHRLDRADQQLVEVGAGHPVQHELVEPGQVGGAEVLVALGVEVGVGQLAVFAQLLPVGQARLVGDGEVAVGLQVEPGPAPRHQREDGPLDQGLHRPGEVVVQAGQGDVGAGVGVVDGVDVAAGDQGLAGVELPPEERVDQLPDRHHLEPGVRGQEVVLDRVAQVHGLVRLELHHHGLGADGQRAGEDVVVDGLLQVHEHLAAGVVGRVQFVGVLDPGHAAPGSAVVGLHEQRVADLLGDRVQVEGLVVAGRGVDVTRVVDRVLVRNQDRLRHLEPEPHHRAVGRVLLHRLERERAVEQVDPVHHGDLLEPLPGVVVPVRQAVDDQVVAGLVTQAERLDGDPLDVEGVRAARPVDRTQPAQDLGEGRGPVVLGAEQEPDRVPGQWLPPVSAESRQVVGQLGAPGRPVVRDVIPP